MENKTDVKNVTNAAAAAAPVPVKKLKELPFNAVVRYESRQDFGSNYTKTIVAIFMHNPFANATIKAGGFYLDFTKPDNKDKRGQTILDVPGKRNEGLFTHFSEIRLDNDEPDGFEVSGVVTYKQFKGQSFVAIDLKNPFSSLKNDTFRMHIETTKARGVFEHYAVELLELQTI